MQSFTSHREFIQPGRIHFGAGALRDCASLLVTLNCHRVLVVHSASIAAALEPLFSTLDRDSFQLTRLTGVPPEPGVDHFSRYRQEIAGRDFDAVVGIGGGSVLDVAKLLAALHDRDEPVQTFFGSGLLAGRRLRLICVPTTAGAGSEVSPNAILYDATDGQKKAVISPHLVPDAAIIDPSLALTLPAAVTAATGVDALVHCIEGFANLAAHPVIDHHALEGIRLISANLARAVHNGSDLEARSALALGSLYGGLCLGPVNTAAVHALAYPLGSELRIAHGLSNALLLTPVLRFNLPAAPARYATIARALGVSAAGDDLTVAGLGFDRLDALIRDCGLPRGIGALGVKREQIPAFATAALRVTRLLRNNPRVITQSDAEAIYQQAL
jgi:alcohol dehydrogenase class IV